MMEPGIWLIYLGVGAVVGFLTGLLGIGGGLIIVPILSLIFTAKGFPAAHVLHMALGTSLAAIIVGAISSARTHHLHEAVNWAVVKQQTPGIVAGNLCGAVFAHFIGTTFLKSFFLGFVVFVAIQFLLDIKPKPHRTLPGPIGQTVFGYLMGFVSSLAGIGGAAFSISFLVWCNVSMRVAIGTAAAVGIPLSIAGTLGYIGMGALDANLPAWSLGYVYLPAWLGISLASLLMAPVGARLAHRLPVKLLKRIFMLFVVGLAIKMAVSV